jgi:ribose transport system substrate-binding protein
MDSRGSVFIASGIILTIVAVIIVAAWLRYRLPTPVVAIIPETTAQELWESEHAGVAVAIAGTPWGTYWNGPSSEDQVAQQIALVQHSESIHAAGLILSPDDCLALTTPVRHVLDKGIPTVIVSTGLPIDPRRNLGFVLNDDKAAGELAATHVARLLKNHGTVALLGNNSHVLSSTARAESFAQTLKSRFPGILLVAQPQGSFRLGETEQQAEAVLRANPKLSAIVSIGITQTRGTMFALRSFGRQNNVALIAFDQDLDLMYSLRRGDIDAVVAQDTFSMGKQAMRMIEQFQHNSITPARIQVAPVLVTRDNIDDPGIQQVLSMDWRPRQP